MSPPTGSVLGAALTDLMAKARVKAREVTLPAEKEAQSRLIRSIMEQGETDLAPLATEILAAFGGPDDLPAPVARLFGLMTTPEHQWDFLITLVAIAGLAMSLPQALAAPVAKQLEAQQWTRNPSMPLSAQEAALAVIRGEIDDAEGAAVAAANGFDARAWRLMTLNTGDTLGLEELLAAYRRGIIDRGRLDHGIAQSRVRTEWADVVEALRFQPLPPAQAVAAAVQNHLDEGQAKELFAQGGIHPDWFATALATAGRPPGIDELVELNLRGELTDAELVQAIRETDVKNKYIPAILAIRRRIPPLERVITMARKGVIEQAKASRYIAQLGYNAEDTAAMVAEAFMDKTQPERDLAKGEIATLYEDQAVTRDQAVGWLVDLGYSTEEAGFLLAIVDARRERRFTEAAIGRVRTLYVGHHIGLPQLSADLDRLGVPATQRDALVDLWNLEREANVRQLTEAQVRRALSDGLIDDQGYLERVQAMGYTEPDARILLSLATGAPSAG